MQRTIEKIHQLDFLLIFFFIFLSLSRKKQPHHRTAYSPGARCYPSLFFYLPIIYLYLYVQYHKLCVSINHHTLLPSNHKHHRIRHHNPHLQNLLPILPQNHRDHRNHPHRRDLSFSENRNHWNARKCCQNRIHWHFRKSCLNRIRRHAHRNFRNC